MSDTKSLSPADVERARIAFREIAELASAAKELLGSIIQAIPRDCPQEAQFTVVADHLMSQIGFVADVGVAHVGSELDRMFRSPTEWLMPPIYQSASNSGEADHD